MKNKYLTDYLKYNAENYGGQVAIVFEGQQITWEQLWTKVHALSGFFESELGRHHQQVVDLLLTNSIDFVVVYLSILHAGHIALPLDPAYKKLELDAIVEQVPPAMIVTDERYKNQIGHRVKTIMIDELKSFDTPASRPLRIGPAGQIASLTFTSGTSGQPKVVPNTHYNHAWNINACSKVWDWTHDDTLLITLPLSHMHGLVMGLSGVLYHGNTLYLRQQSFDAKAILEDLSSGKISLFTHAPIAYMKMLAQSGNYDLSGVRLMISGSAPLPPSLWQDFKNRFGVEVVETYGTSETGRIAANRLSQKKQGSPGKVLPGVNLKFSHENEVLIKSGGVFPGYFKNQAATDAARAEDGYWRTGDIGELEDGYLILKGRVQERIRRFGYTISPRDVEWALLENPKIKEAFVLGRQNSGQPNDELIYFIVTSLSNEQLRDYCHDNLLFAWRPDKIIQLQELPRTRSGKARIGTLKELAGREA